MHAQLTQCYCFQNQLLYLALLPAMTSENPHLMRRLCTSTKAAQEVQIQDGALQIQRGRH